MKNFRPYLPGLVYSILIPIGFLSLIGFSANAQVSALVKFGNSYVNITKQTTGGTVEPGDILEIRSTIYIRNNYNTSGRVYYARYVDNIPTNTAILAGSPIRTVTNEGLTIYSYTQAAGDDAATYKAVPGAGEFNIRVNLGNPVFGPAPGVPTNNTVTNVTGAGSIRGGTTKPKANSGTLFSTAFRVVVTGNYGDTITLGAGRFAYKLLNLLAGADTTILASQYKILIQKNDALCNSSSGVNFAGEFGGSFGTGNTLNRSTGPSFSIPAYTYIPNVSRSVAVGDGTYSIVNNTSPKAATNPFARRTPNCNVPAGPIPSLDSCNGRMFNGYWFIAGDHTGTNNAAGNPPVADGTSGGYMLMVNADLATSEAYRQTITGLCPETYYQFSAWIKNICPTCGIDSNGTATYKPGVNPNLTFVIDDIDRFSSGEVDTLGWLQKGGLFKTNPGQTSITISIRNNAPGGGGNDWVMDDINFSVCQPQITFDAYPVMDLCVGNLASIDAHITSNYDNYTYYKWQISTNGGASWSDAGVSGNATTSWNGSVYEYFVNYPPFLANLSDSGKIYRVVVGTTASNLSNSNCSFADAAGLLNLNVTNCVVLPTDLTDFSGSLINGYALLKWKTQNETEKTQYLVERSTDGSHFQQIGTITGNAGSGTLSNSYDYTDPQAVKGNHYYRLRIYSTTSGKTTYSKIVLLSNDKVGFDVKNMINPFSRSIKMDIQLPEKGEVRFTLFDNYGRMMETRKIPLEKGINNYQFDNLEHLSKGVYTLRINYQDEIINKRLIKY